MRQQHLTASMLRVLSIVFLFTLLYGSEIDGTAPTEFGHLFATQPISLLGGTLNPIFQDLFHGQGPGGFLDICFDVVAAGWTANSPLL